jgi:adenylate cyclase
VTLPSIQRKLAAIFSADVQGYSRLMGDDEVATVRTLTAYRDVMATHIQAHRGRVVDSPGDNLLAEFASVVDAVECAVAIQHDLKARNAELPAPRQMIFRIGINLGDVIVEGDRLYGDGINIAARIEGLAEGGGICLSGTAYDQVENKLSVGYEWLGEHVVKNIAKPVRVYRVLTDPASPAARGGTTPRAASRARRRLVLAVGLLVLLMGMGGVAMWTFSPRVSEVRTALALPDKPSIAVLPLANLSDDPQQEYFSDGMTEDLITALSKISGLFVIARTSVFTYKGKPVKVQQVSQDLGVRYVLEGSVRKAAERVRITAQLIDATTGTHLWAERYDRVLEDVFTVQDEITRNIVTALEVQLTSGEQVRLWRQGTTSPEAYDTFLRGRDYAMRKTREDTVQARRLFERAIELDPGFAMAYVGLASTFTLEVRLGWSPSLAEPLQRARELTHKAIALDDALADAYGQLGYILLLQRQHEQAITAGQHAIALSPNGADVHALLAVTLNFSGRPADGLAMIEKAMRLSPVYPSWYVHVLGMSHYLVGRYEEALAAFMHSRDRSPDAWFPYVGLVLTSVQLGREGAARVAAAEILKRDPAFSLERYAAIQPYQNSADLTQELDILRQGGLK